LKVGILHTAFIGDVILSSLLVEVLFQAGHEIIYFTQKKTSSLFLCDLRVKKVVEINKKKGFEKILSLKQIANQIRSENCDVLFVPHRSATSTLCAYFSGVKKTIGFHNANLSFLYSTNVKFDKNAHECVRYLALCESFVDKKILNEGIKLGRPILRYAKNMFDDFRKKFSQFYFLDPAASPVSSPRDDTLSAINSTREDNPFFILAVGSVWKTKKYPIEHWVEVIFAFLCKNRHLTCLLTGADADREDAFAFLELFQEKCLQHKDENLIFNVVYGVNGFSLFEFGLLTSFAQFVLCNDSSPIHFASAFNIPVLSIFGPTIPEFGFAPTSQNSLIISYANEKGHRLPCQPCSIHGKNICPKGHFWCMNELKPKTVLKGIDQLLGKIPAT
jgi:heptosyltransferase-2